METVVIVLLVALGIVLVVGGIVAFLAFRRAPNGLEDREGFRRTDKSKRK